jgi:hypothetical protein
VTAPYGDPGPVVDDTQVTGPGTGYPGPRRPVERTVIEREVDDVPPVSRPVVVRSGPGIAQRIVVLVFGLIQLIILLRIVLLLADAVRTNSLVSSILDLSQVFVAPFVGILRTNAMSAGGSTLDVAAIVALIGWTIFELVVLAIVNTVVDRGSVA